MPVAPEEGLSATHELDVARAAARQAGQILLAHFRAARTSADPAARAPGAPGAAGSAGDARAAVAPGSAGDASDAVAAKVTAKADGSPLTAADTLANQVLVAALGEAFPDDAILSEESEDDGMRRRGRRVWIVDPLDGTRDFIAGSPEFAVHVALVEAGRPVLAVVYQPATGLLCEARPGQGAFAVRPGEPPARLRVSVAGRLADVRLGHSVHAPGDRLRRLLAETGLGARARPVGASIKWLAVAAGALDGVLCLHDGEKEWDTCAPALVLGEAGGRVSDVDGRALIWNQDDVRHQRGLVASNGACHEALLAVAGRYWPA